MFSVSAVGMKSLNDSVRSWRMRTNPTSNAVGWSLYYHSTPWPRNYFYFLKKCFEDLLYYYLKLCIHRHLFLCVRYVHWMAWSCSCRWLKSCRTWVLRTELGSFTWAVGTSDPRVISPTTQGSLKCCFKLLSPVVNHCSTWLCFRTFDNWAWIIYIISIIFSLQAAFESSSVNVFFFVGNTFLEFFNKKQNKIQIECNRMKPNSQKTVLKKNKTGVLTSNFCTLEVSSR